MGNRVREISAQDLDSVDQFQIEIVAPCRPVVIRGLVDEWPAVAAARVSSATFRDYVTQFDNGQKMGVFVGAPEIAGKYFYGDDLSDYNFERRASRLLEAIDEIVANSIQSGMPSLYVGSLPLEQYLPGFEDHNAISRLLPAAKGRIWLGNAANVAAHYDAMDNLACVIAGSRRFTLFAPEMIESLYVGPIDKTLAGQPVSLAAGYAPDPSRFPAFEAIKGTALICELEAGDALFLPKLWWHQVESTKPFNGLVNYWWDAHAAGPDAPYTAMLLALITISERPEAERLAWRAFFDHYVFRPNGHPLRHLSEAEHGVLGPLKANYGKLRAGVMNLLRLSP